MTIAITSSAFALHQDFCLQKRRTAVLGKDLSSSISKHMLVELYGNRTLRLCDPLSSKLPYQNWFAPRPPAIQETSENPARLYLHLGHFNAFPLSQCASICCV